MFTIGPNLGTYFQIPDEIVKKLEEIDKDNRKRIQRAAKKAEESTNEFTNQLAAAAKLIRQNQEQLLPPLLQQQPL
jgi:hypothetical protein